MHWPEYHAGVTVVQVNEPSALNTRGRGAARGITRRRCGAHRGLGQGRGVCNTSAATQAPTAEQRNGGANTIVDRTGRHWTTEPPEVHRQQVQDIIRQQPGVTSQGRKNSIKEVFQLYLCEEIQSVVIRETN